jgi:hypothetical protein
MAHNDGLFDRGSGLSRKCPVFPHKKGWLVVLPSSRLRCWAKLRTDCSGRLGDMHVVMGVAVIWTTLLCFTFAWEVQLPQTYSMADSTTITVIDGISLWSITKSFCQHRSYKECVTLTYYLSYYYYGIIYFPTRPLSCIEDFHQQRKDLITYVTKRFNYQSYLEIGCDQDQTYGQIKDLFHHSLCVDPTKGGTLRMTSDQFFEQYSDQERFDVIFIDGLHEAPQVWKDVVNSLRVLNDNGVIILHDLNPLLEEYQVVPDPGGPMIWNGDCWKVGLALRLIPDLDFVIGDFDHGIGILRKKPNSAPLPKEWEDQIQTHMIENPFPETFLNALSFDEFHENREVLQRLMTIAEVRAWLEQ